MQEIWKDIEGFEGLYQVSNYGRVKSLDRVSEYYSKAGYYSKRAVKGRILSIASNPAGYRQVILCKQGEHTQVMIHRLVAKTFLPNPDLLPEVNHKDENKSNNHVDNLEWCTPKYNANYGTRNDRCKKVIELKAVNQFSKDGTFIQRFESITAAHKALGIDMSQISGVCKHKKEYVTAGGFKWEYA